MHLTAKLCGLCKNNPFVCFKIIAFKSFTVPYYLVCEKGWITLYSTLHVTHDSVNI